LAVQRLDSLMRNPHEEFQNSVEAFAVDGSGCKFSDSGQARELTTMSNNDGASTQEPSGSASVDSLRSFRSQGMEEPAPQGAPATDIAGFYDAHGAELYRFSYRMLQDRHRAEEAVQDTFVRAWKHSEKWDGALGSQRTWLFSIAHNVCIDAIRARTSRPALAHSTIENTETIEPSLESAMDSWLVEEALRRIREDQRVAIVETYLKGKTYSEVAAATGANEATLRSRVFYGLKALRLALEELGWTP
jgi:RNA polymerase sigma-70 factor, ECF subfamily